MKISIQQSQNRNLVGLFNCFTHRGHEVLWWDDNADTLKDFRPDVAFFCRTEGLGYRAYGAVGKAVNVFLGCTPSEECKAEKKLAIEGFPPLADTVLFPPAYFHKSLAVDAFYLSIYPLETEEQVQSLNMIDPISGGFSYRAAGNVLMPHVSYIGKVYSPEDSSKLCRSASVCIDFGLKQAFDLLKIGCRVITDTPNDLDIPVFNPSTINGVIKTVLSTPKPILNKYEEKILSFNQFCTPLSQLIGVNL